jgi:hypothetical protein
MTQAGLFLIDLPKGNGGVISFNVTKAAAIADLANKSYVAISYGGASCAGAGGCTTLLAFSSGAVSGGTVTFGGFTSLGGSTPSSVVVTPFSAGGAQTNTTTTGGTQALPAAGTNALVGTYADPSTFPGFFYTDENDGSSHATPSIIAFMKTSAGRILFFGTNTHYNASNNCAGNTLKCLTASGNFIGFSK